MREHADQSIGPPPSFVFPGVVPRSHTGNGDAGQHQGNTRARRRPATLPIASEVFRGFRDIVASGGPTFWILLLAVVGGCTLELAGDTDLEGRVVVVEECADSDTDTGAAVEEPLVYAFLGDSLTASTASSYTYIDLLPEALGQPIGSVGHVDAGTVWHDGVSGYTSRMALAEVETWTDDWSGCPDRALIWYGTADAIYRTISGSPLSVPVAESISNVDAIADHVEVLCPDVEVYFGTLPGVTSSTVQAQVEAHNAAISGVLDAPNRHLVDTRPGYSATTMAPDGTHYGRAGAVPLAGNWADGL